MNDVSNVLVTDISCEDEMQSRNFRRRIFSVVLVALVLLGMVAAAWYLLSDGPEAGSQVSAAERTPALTVTLTKPRRVLWPVSLSASGSIAPWQEASIETQVGGYQLVEVRVNVGDQVHRGQLTRAARLRIAACRGSATARE